VPRGLSSRASRIRRPGRGATRTKSAVSTATATTGALGTSAPDVPAAVPCEVPSSPKGENKARGRSGGAGRALGCFTVGVDATRFSGPGRGCQADVDVFDVVGGGIVEPGASAAGPAALPLDFRPRGPDGVSSGELAWDAGVSGASVTTTTDTSTPGNVGGDSGPRGSTEAGSWGPTPIATAMSTTTSTAGAPRPARDGSAPRVDSPGSRPPVSSLDVACGSEDESEIVPDGTDITLPATSLPAAGESATSPGCALSDRLGGGPTAASHDQFHAHSHVQLSGVPLGVSVTSAVVWSQKANVQLQFQGSSAGAVPVVSGPAGADELVVVWLTGPFSPGLSTRIDTFVLPGAEEVVDEEPTSPPEPAPEDVESGPGMTGSPSVHDQSHIHFHVQSSEDGLPDSVEDVVAFPSQSIVYHQLQYHASLEVEESD